MLAVLVTLAGCEVGTEPPEATANRAEAGARRAPPATLSFVQGYRQGYAESVRQRKPMLLFFTAGWCEYCHQMADEAFTDPQVVRLSRQFVCVEIDADAELEICRQFEVTGYPTLLFLSPRGVPLERVVGKRPGHQVMMAMQSALQHVARRNVPREFERH